MPPASIQRLVLSSVMSATAVIPASARSEKPFGDQTLHRGKGVSTRSAEGLFVHDPPEEQKDWIGVFAFRPGGEATAGGWTKGLYWGRECALVVSRVNVCTYDASGPAGPDTR